MNKTHINILSVLILGLLVIKVVIPFIGLDQRIPDSSRTHELVDTHTPFVAQLSENEEVPFSPTDTMTFESGVSHPVILKQLSVIIPDKDVPGWLQMTTRICRLLNALMLLFGFYEFIRFIININRSKIFVMDNVKRLRRFGWAMIMITVFSTIDMLVEGSFVSGLDLAYAGRKLNTALGFAYNNTIWCSILVGIAGLLMASIWARGIYLREEHDLTI